MPALGNAVWISHGLPASKTIIFCFCSSKYFYIGGLAAVLLGRVCFDTLVDQSLKFWGLFLLFPGVVFTSIDAFDVNLAEDYLKLS